MHVSKVSEISISRSLLLAKNAYRPYAPTRAVSYDDNDEECLRK